MSALTPPYISSLYGETCQLSHLPTSPHCVVRHVSSHTSLHLLTVVHHGINNNTVSRLSYADTYRTNNWLPTMSGTGALLYKNLYQNENQNKCQNISLLMMYDIWSITGDNALCNVYCIYNVLLIV